MATFSTSVPSSGKKTALLSSTSLWKSSLETEVEKIGLPAAAAKTLTMQ